MTRYLGELPSKLGKRRGVCSDTDEIQDQCFRITITERSNDAVTLGPMLLIVTQLLVHAN